MYNKGKSSMRGGGVIGLFVGTATAARTIAPSAAPVHLVLQQAYDTYMAPYHNKTTQRRTIPGDPGASWGILIWVYIHRYTYMMIHHDDIS